MSVGLCLRDCATAASAAASISSDRLSGLNGRRSVSLSSLGPISLSRSCNLVILKLASDRRSRMLMDRICVLIPVVEVGVCDDISPSPSESAFSRSVSDPEALETDSARFRAREEDPAELDVEGAGDRRLTRRVVGDGADNRAPDEMDVSLSRTCMMSK